MSSDPQSAAPLADFTDAEALRYEARWNDEIGGHPGLSARYASIADRLAALEAVAAAARAAVDAIDAGTWAEASPKVAALEAALNALDVGRG